MIRIYKMVSCVYKPSEDDDNVTEMLDIEQIDIIRIEYEVWMPLDLHGRSLLVPKLSSLCWAMPLELGC